MAEKIKISVGVYREECDILSALLQECFWLNVSSDLKRGVLGNRNATRVAWEKED